MPKLAWVLIATGALAPVACAQVAGLDQEYTAANDAGTASAKDSASVTDARSDAPDEPDAPDVPDAVDTCDELSKTDDVCALCVIFDANDQCQNVCGDRIENSAREAYFDCLRNEDDAENCAKAGRFDLPAVLDPQRDCIRTCQDRGLCNAP